jgi:hypothetical protein
LIFEAFFTFKILLFVKICPVCNETRDLKFTDEICYYQPTIDYWLRTGVCGQLKYQYNQLLVDRLKSKLRTLASLGEFANWVETVTIRACIFRLIYGINTKKSWDPEFAMPLFTAKYSTLKLLSRHNIIKISIHRVVFAIKMKVINKNNRAWIDTFMRLKQIVTRKVSSY